ncbi:MAG: metalloregulator ArsR/SmtB family transcription factor [Candidatus Altiarchaeota archaeon]
MAVSENEKCRCLKEVPKLSRILFSARELESKTRLMRLLSHPTRMQVLRILSEKDVCVCVLCRLLKKSQPNISQHLSKLKDNGIVGCYQRGKLVYYRISDPDVKATVKRI